MRCDGKTNQAVKHLTVLYQAHPVLHEWCLTGNQSDVTQNTEMKLRLLSDTFAEFVESHSTTVELCLI